MKPDVETMKAKGLAQSESELRAIAIHHSGRDPWNTPQEIMKFHRKERGKSDIGYHFLIDENGKIYEGRSLKWVGSGIGGDGEEGVIAENRGIIGICVMGNHDLYPPTFAQSRAIEDLCKYLVQAHPGISTLGGHRDFAPPGHPTECPGRFLYMLLGKYRLSMVLAGSSTN